MASKKGAMSLYESKEKPVRLVCEVCGIKKDCVPCKNWKCCRRGRCPVCFPTVLQLHHDLGIAKQLAVQKRIWDMEFVCETCCINSKRAPILRSTLQFQSGQAAVRLEGCTAFYMTRDGKLLTQEEYAKLTQRQKQQKGAPAPAAQQQQQRPAPKAAQQPQAAQQQQQPRQAAAPAQQAKPAARPAPPAAAAAAAAAAGPLKEKRPSDGGEPARKRLKSAAAAVAAAGGARPPSAQQQARAAQQQPKKAPPPPAAAAEELADDSEEELGQAAGISDEEGGSSSEGEGESSSSEDDDEDQPAAAAAAVPAKKPAAAAAAAAGALPGKQPKPPDKQQPAAAAAAGRKPAPAPAAKPAAAAGASKPGAAQQTAAQRLGQQQQAPPGKKPAAATAAAAASKPAAAAPAARPPGAAAAAGGAAAAKAAAARRSPSPGAAAAAVPAARGLKRRTPDSSGEGDVSSDGLPLSDLPSHVRAQAAAAAAAGGGAAAGQGSRLKQASGQQQGQQQQQQRAGLTAKPSAGAAAAATAGKQQVKPGGQQRSPSPQQQQAGRGLGLAPKQSGEAAAKPAGAAAAAAAAKLQQASKPAGAGAAGRSQAPAAAAAAAGAPGKGEISRKQLQDRGAAAPAAPAAAAGRPSKPAAAASEASEEEEGSDEESEEGAGGSQGQQGEESGSSEDIDEDQQEKIFGSLAPQEPAAAAAAGGAAAKKPAQRRQLPKPRGQAVAANGLPGGRGAGAGAGAAGAAAAAGAAPAAVRVKKKAFNVYDFLQEGMGDGDFPSALPASGGGSAFAAAVGATRRTARARPAAPRPASNLWPVRCRAEVAGPNFRYEFSVRIKPAPERSGVAVPPLLEKMRGDGTLHCMFWDLDTVLDCVQADNGTGAQFEGVFDEPAPMLFAEVAHEQRLPAVVRHMVEARAYMRVWGHGSSLFFAPVLRENNHAVDYGRLSPAEQAHLPDRVAKDALGLVMFRDSQEGGGAVPPEYGTVIASSSAKEGEEGGDSAQATPTAAAARAAALYDESCLQDTDMDFLYDDIIFANVLASGARLRMHAMNMDGAGDVAAMNAAMNTDGGHGGSAAMDVDEQSPGGQQGQGQQQQQRQRRVQFAQQLSQLGGGMGRELLGGPADPRRARMPARPSVGVPEGLDGGVASAAAAAGVQQAADASLAGGGSEHQQQPSQQLDQQLDPQQQQQLDQIPSPAAVAAGSAAGLSPEQQQQQQPAGPGPPTQPPQQQDQQQQQQQQQDLQQGLGPLQQVLSGGRPRWPLMPGPQQVLQVLRSRGLPGLVVYLDEGSFHELTEPGKGTTTRRYVASARERGVTVYAPGDPPGLPPPGSVHVMMVTKVHMNKCGLEVDLCRAHTMQYLASGALVVNENFIVELLHLPPGGAALLQQLDRKDTALAGILADAFFATGVVLLLDLSLLLVTPADAIRDLLEQLHSLKPLMTAPGAQVMAYAQDDHLRAAAKEHMDGEWRWNEYRQELTGKTTPGRCGILDRRYMSSKTEPRGTHMLRNAHKVSFNFNKPSQCQAEHTAPLRFTVVVTAEPDDPALTPEQRAAVAQLLDNGDGAHKTVIGATLRQTRHLLAAIREQLSG